MKKFLLALPLLMLGGLARAVTNGAIAISSGSNVYAVDVSSVGSNGNARQNIVIADPTLTSGLAPVSSVTGLTVNLASSTAAIGTVTQGAAGTADWHVTQSTNTVTGTVTSNQGTAGTADWRVTMSTASVTGSVTASQPNAYNVVSTSTVLGTGSNAIGSITNTGFNVNNSPTVNQGTAGTADWHVTQSTNQISQANALNVVSTQTAVAGDVASGSSDSGNPVKIGGIGRVTYQTAVTDGQRAAAQLDSEGKQVFMPYAVPALSTSGVTAAMTGTASTVILSSGATGVNTYVTHLSCFNSHATVGTVINIKNGNIVKYTGYAVAAGGGFSVTFPTALPPEGTVKEWTATNATTGSNTYCNMVGYLTKN